MKLLAAANALLPVNLDEVEFLDLNGKLALLSVAADQKPAYAAGLRERPRSDETFGQLSVFGSQYGLQVRMTKQPPSSLHDESVPEFYSTESAALSRQGDVLRLFREESVARQISSVEAGDSNPGIVLGYPACCVEAHDKFQVEQLKRFYRQFVKQFRPRSESEAIAIVRSDPPLEVADYADSLNRTAGLTFARFPFVSHVACPDCLTRKITTTADLNERYRAVAAKAGATLYTQILASKPTLAGLGLQSL